jgi:phosphoribosylformylglycinamidine synthase
LGDEPADLNRPELLRGFFEAIQASLAAGDLLAYHDRSDGGLLVTLAEMAFAGHCGLDIDISELGEDPLAVLFSEELGAVLQVSRDRTAQVQARFAEAGLSARVIGEPNEDDWLRIQKDGETLFDQSRVILQSLWAETSYRLQALRDNPECARQEYESLMQSDPGLSVKLTYDPQENIAAPYINLGIRPSVAVLREQGVNSHVEMAAAFDRAGFRAVDVHMSDLLSGRVTLDGFKGLVACGGFSYGDVLGAGEGWAKTILFNNRARDQFAQFFHRAETFSLGVCNGCQMMSNLKSLIPGADHWPRFVRNLSEQFEARFNLVQVQESPSVLFAGMAGSHMPVVVSHGEGRAEFASEAALQFCNQSGTVAVRYVDNHLQVTEKYPANPNGSPLGITAVTSRDGRATIMMPHPERVFRSVTNSWHPDHWQDDGAWLRLFRNARVFVN